MNNETFANRMERQSDDAAEAKWGVRPNGTRGLLGLGKALIVENRILTVPVSDEVQRAIQQWAHQHSDTLRAALEPYGLDPADIAAPVYTRIVYRDEL